MLNSAVRPVPSGSGNPSREAHDFELFGANLPRSTQGIFDFPAAFSLDWTTPKRFVKARQAMNNERSKIKKMPLSVFLQMT